MQALTDQQQFGKADEMYDKCIDLEPDNATTYVHKGYVFAILLVKGTGRIQMNHPELDVCI